MSCVVAVVILWSTTLDLSRQAGTTGAQVAAGESVAGRSSAARELPPALAWPNYAVMPDVNASTSAGIQGEVSIAIDAAQPTRAVAASMDLRGAGILVMASNDRGRTWSRHSLPRGEGASFHADPMVDFDSRGVAHLAHIPVANGNVPLGIEVTRSFDGGHTWTPAQRISANRGRDDKVILRADNNLASLYRDRVYVAWKWPPGGCVRLALNGSRCQLQRAASHRRSRDKRARHGRGRRRYGVSRCQRTLSEEGPRVALR